VVAKATGNTPLFSAVPAGETGDTGTQTILLPGSFEDQSPAAINSTSTVTNPYKYTNPKSAPPIVKQPKLQPPVNQQNPYQNGITNNDQRGEQSTSEGAIRQMGLIGRLREGANMAQAQFGAGGTETRINRQSPSGQVDGNRIPNGIWKYAPGGIKKGFFQWKSLDRAHVGWFTGGPWSSPTFAGTPATDFDYFTGLAWNYSRGIAAGHDPELLTPKAQAEGQGQSLAAGNASADMARNQAASAITYVGSAMLNFTTDGGNKWNQIRNEIFVPMAVLLLLPGAVLAQAAPSSLPACGPGRSQPL